MLRSRSLRLRSPPSAHRPWRRRCGHRARADAAPPGPADQDRPARRRKARAPVSRRGTHRHPRPRRERGGRARCRPLPRRYSPRRPPLAASRAQAPRPSRAGLSHRQNWSRAHWQWIREQRFDLPPLQRAFEATLFALEQALARQAELDQELEAVTATASYREPVGWLRCFRGIDTLSAIILLAEVVDFQRFRRPRELMAYLGLVPSEYSSGESQRRGALTKAGNSHARRILVEAAWHYRHRPTIGRALASRTHGQPDEVVAQAWRAQQRLHRRYRHLVSHGKRTPVAVAAVARELVGFIWAAMTRHESRRAAA